MLCSMPRDSQTSPSPFGRTLLVTGPESLLADRAVTERVEAARAIVPEVEISWADAGELEATTLSEMCGGSLFASQRMAVIRSLSELNPDLVDMMVGLAKQPDPEIALVLVHPGGVKGKGLLDKLRKLKGTVDVVTCQPLKAWELGKFVQAEFRRLGARTEPQVAQQLVDAQGTDLRGLVAAVRQLHDDADGAPISEQLVSTYFAGRSEVSSFAVADAAIAGQTTRALEQLRWTLSTGTAPVLVTAALAMSLRGLGKFVTAPRGLRDAELAKEVGVPSWKLKTLRSQARGWDQGRIARALLVVAEADADVKGAAENADFALERAVLAISRGRQ
ncbi:MAG TPA: DNA polymerase III subunit delta [Candidatus Avipropionibacterium avicola]|uniref:DNA-directed DNA polymerase n=1 Tax=Candidatus Avipropionibacterium avicola TaxID=2840701 RepID=A0A9D1KNJ9_9ACTN|nr:DNA polymerase III subunit delta [Candidatus Avipropionibacterium avicola]